ncbi:thiol-disulfide oxidoreductase DCC family protein [Fibrella sp. ES10-3-2-2]|nr:hypothetical protein A6C57_25045 [Fibrella sp. ES10-3-2-2]
MTILFDGVCNLCNGLVQFVIRHDPAGRFTFAALQSASGQALLKAHGLRTHDFDTFVYIRNKTAYTRSTAGLLVMRDLGGGWQLLYPLVFFPRVVRDAVYTLIAQNRYRFFGRQDACMLPTPELKSRFLT